MEAVQQFFAENPEAQLCYVALGIACATAEEANALLAGVKGQMVTPYNRETEKEFSKDSDALLSDLCEKADAEAALEAAYQKEPTEAKMQEWVAAKKAVDTAKAAYEKKLAEELKLQTGKDGTEEVLPPAENKEQTQDDDKETIPAVNEEEQNP